MTRLEDKNIREIGSTVGQLVAEDYRTAKVFEKYGIDFCCGGSVSLATACREKGIDPGAILRELDEARSTPLDRERNFASWELTLLADHIVATHHAFLRENLAQIAVYTKKIAEVHGSNHPELSEIAGIFDTMAKGISDHLREEEEILFPAVKRIETARKAGGVPDRGDLAIILDGLEKLTNEHEEIGEAVHAIRRLSGDYAVPGDGCTTYQLTYRKLREFEDDLHEHVHLENNILFPKAAEFRT